MLTVNFSPFPVLETERLLLRGTTPENVDALYALRANGDVMRYIDRPRPKSNDDILALIEKIQNIVASNNGIEWGLTLKETGKYIGTISFHQLIKENYRAEIGYLLDPAQHGKGIMDEAMKAVLDYGFNIMQLHSVEANVNPENMASRKLLERNGFAQEAYFKENHFWNGQFFDTVIYSLLAPAR
ncbi:MAG: GNAT family protein [Bacteroidota bacterium]